MTFFTRCCDKTGEKKPLIFKDEKKSKIKNLSIPESNLSKTLSDVFIPSIDNKGRLLINFWRDFAWESLAVAGDDPRFDMVRRLLKKTLSVNDNFWVQTLVQTIGSALAISIATTALVVHYHNPCKKKPAQQLEKDIKHEQKSYQDNSISEDIIIEPVEQSSESKTIQKPTESLQQDETFHEVSLQNDNPEDNKSKEIALSSPSLDTGATLINAAVALIAVPLWNMGAWWCTKDFMRVGLSLLAAGNAASLCTGGFEGPLIQYFLWVILSTIFDKNDVRKKYFNHPVGIVKLIADTILNVFFGWGPGGLWQLVANNLPAVLAKLFLIAFSEIVAFGLAVAFSVLAANYIFLVMGNGLDQGYNYFGCNPTTQETNSSSPTELIDSIDIHNNKKSLQQTKSWCSWWQWPCCLTNKNDENNVVNLDKPHQLCCC